MCGSNAPSGGSIEVIFFFFFSPEFNCDTSLPNWRLTNQDESVSGAGVLGGWQQFSLPMVYLVLPFVLKSLP